MLLSSDPAGATCITVAATFTAEPLREPIEFWLQELKWECGVRFAPYNQVFQELLNPSGVLASSACGLNVLLVRPQDWVRYRNGASARAELAAHAVQFVDAVRTAAGALRVPLLAVVCPASPTDGLDDAVEEAERTLEEGLAAIPQVLTATAGEIAELYPVWRTLDEQSDRIGHIPYTQAYFAALGTFVVRKLHALRVPPFKVAALDCDDTLWRGVCGEDGPEGVTLDAACRSLQERLVEQRAAGMLLCLASRNNEEDVRETFAAHPEFPLRMDHFAAHRINWQAKSGNLAELASELNLSLDSFLFLDDNPEECAEVQEDEPDVAVLPLPENREETPRWLRHVWAFDRIRVTEEDRRRAQQYQVEARRAQSQRQASNLAEFIASLQLKVEMSPARPEQMARIAQLTQRTNQMNCAARRRTESELEALLRGGVECLAAEVSDRFGGYGLTGVALYEREGDLLRVDTLLLSCRVLGRGVEHNVVAELGRLATEAGASAIEIPFRATARNRPARAFLDSLGAAVSESSDGARIYRLEATAASRLRYTPPNAPLVRETARPAAGSGRPKIDYRRIAAELNDAPSILEAMRRRHAPATAAVEGTVLEQQLAALWAELLRLPRVGPEENFFDLGGHSLLAVQLLAEVKRQYGVEVSFETVYGGSFTVASLAEAIELEQIKTVGADEYAALLAEISQLSDAEAGAMLSELTAEDQREA
jgi:FkbH-like protein